MTITNAYCSLAEVKAALRLTDAVDDGLLTRAIESASRRVDGYTGRFFYTRQATVDLYATNDRRLMVPDIATTSGLTVRTDDADDGTYSTVWALGVDYLVEPTDRALQDRPITALSASGNRLFPSAIYPWRGLVNPTVRPLVRVVATWGWPAIPHDVREATVLLSMRQFARLNAPLGVVGFADMAVTVRAVDPDVRDLLQPYKLLGIA